MNSSQKKLIVILLVALFALGLVLLVNKTVNDMAAQTEPPPPETFAPETFVSVASDEANITVLGSHTEEEYASVPAVTDWLMKCREEERDGIGLYALCYRSTAAGSTTMRYLILRTGVYPDATVTADVKRGATFYTATVSYSGYSAGSGYDLFEIILTLPEGAKQELDVFFGSAEDPADLLLTYTDVDFAAAKQ